MWEPGPPFAPPGRKHDMAPARRSAQSLGRNCRPLDVMPWMKTSRGLTAAMAAAAGAAGVELDTLEDPTVCAMGALTGCTGTAAGRVGSPRWLGACAEG